MKNKKWKVFQISQIFNIYTGASISQDKFTMGDVPRITATNTNNGIGLFTSNFEDKNYRKLKNFISISFLGGVFYHLYEASLDMKIHGLQIKNQDLNPNLAKFLITCLVNSLPEISYGNQLSSGDLLAKNILLPIKKNGQPDWTFMEGYIQRQVEQINKAYTLPEKQEIRDDRNLEEVEWSDFFVDDIVE